jgi:7,8-dihydropterin-6-yl-methyl-4-(beta-D-ribofuranosyl)aminobenzene 5'-phosphate synthase
MTRHLLFTAAALVALATAIDTSRSYAQSSTGQITVLYDAFGKDAAMTKDWGFSALVEVAVSESCSIPAMIAISIS